MARKQKKGRKKSSEKNGGEGQDSQETTSPTQEVEVDQGIDNNNCSESVQSNSSVVVVSNHEGDDLKLDDAIRHHILHTAEQTEPMEIQFEQEPNPPTLVVEQKGLEGTTQQFMLVPTQSKSKSRSRNKPATTSLALMPFKSDHVKTVKSKKLADYQKKCAAKDCTKEAAVKCPSCLEILYCTAKHMKVYAKEHDCLAYRFLEKPRIGRYMIAAQEITINGFAILRDDPIVMFPLCKSDREQFSESYCIRCYRMYPDDTSLTRPCQCNLHVCASLSTCEQLTKSPRSMNHSLECAALSSNPLNGLRLNGTVLALFRLMKSSQTEFLTNDLLKKATYLKIPPPPPSFLKKLTIIKTLLPSPILHSDKEAFTLETCIKRFGRNIAPNIGYIYQQSNALTRWTKCVYDKASHVLHSCVPNAVFDYNPQGALILRSIKKIAKGETLTVSYDNRLLFSPAYNRHNVLLQDFCYECTCKRCRSVSELDTYFSSFPCTQCRPQKFIVSQESYVSDWKCQNCKLTITAASVERYMARIWHHMEIRKTPAEIVKAMELLIEENYLHWNNFLVFQQSIRLLEELYKMLELNDMPIIKDYSDSRGLKFKNVANTIINITSIFMPYNYMPCHVLPLRLSGVIKIRELIDQVDQEFINLEQVDKIIWGLYFRSEELYNYPLYDIQLGTPIQERNMCVLELKVLKIMLDSVFPIYGDTMTVLKSMAPYLMRMFVDKVNKHPTLLAEIEVKSSSPLFPFNLLV